MKEEIKLKLCPFCGRRASHHVRISGGKRLAGNAGVEGNGVTYKACCRKCFKKITEGIERVKND